MSSILILEGLWKLSVILMSESVKHGLSQPHCGGWSTAPRELPAVVGGCPGALQGLLLYWSLLLLFSSRIWQICSLNQLITSGWEGLEVHRGIRVWAEHNPQSLGKKRWNLRGTKKVVGVSREKAAHLMKELNWTRAAQELLPVIRVLQLWERCNCTDRYE